MREGGGGRVEKGPDLPVGARCVGPALVPGQVDERELAKEFLGPVGAQDDLKHSHAGRYRDKTYII